MAILLQRNNVKLSDKWKFLVNTAPEFPMIAIKEKPEDCRDSKIRNMETQAYEEQKCPRQVERQTATDTSSWTVKKGKQSKEKRLWGKTELIEQDWESKRS